MHEPSAAGRRTLRVRYYPRRMDRAAAPGPATPSQALHLPRDPARAATAQSTAQVVDLLHPETPIEQASPGSFRRWWQRLFRRTG